MRPVLVRRVSHPCRPRHLRASKRLQRSPRMPDTAISLTAIVVSGVVGPSLSAWWTHRRQREDHERDLRAELAGVLDEGASALGRAKRSFERTYAMHSEGLDPALAEVREVFDLRRRAMQDVRYADDRIAIRLGGDHPVRRAFAACAQTLDRQRDFARAFERGSPIDPAVLEQQQRAHDEFDPTREAFVDAARQLVGPRLA